MKIGMRRMKDVRIGRVVSKLAATVIALYVGGEIMNQIGVALMGKCSGFFGGLTLIGWTLGANTSVVPGANQASVTNCVTNPSSGGILTVIGLVGIASIVMEFVEFRM